MSTRLLHPPPQRVGGHIDRVSDLGVQQPGGDPGELADHGFGRFPPTVKARQRPLMQRLPAQGLLDGEEHTIARLPALQDPRHRVVQAGDHLLERCPGP
ncbi:hypothetical protein ACWECC_03915 [Streptomyces microflavus]